MRRLWDDVFHAVIHRERFTYWVWFQCARFEFCAKCPKEAS